MTSDSTPFVNCITFGSPCQDLSQAGRRAGLKGERSGLFMDAVKVIKEMRRKSNGLYPTFAVWENVPGAFSSNKGEDFRTVLEELARICEAGVSIPRPEKGKWKKSGFIAGDRWSIAWRTLDAKYWGVPQRRRRISLVLDLGGQRAGEILFERTGVSGNLEPSIPPWKGIARNPENRTSGYDRVVERSTAGGNQVTSCLFAAYGTKWNGNSGAYSGDNFVLDADKNSSKAYTLKIRSGCEGGGKGALVQTELSATLSTLQDQTLFVLQGNAIDRDVKQNGAGFSDSETMFTLNTTDKHGVAYPLNDQGGSSINVENGALSPTLRAESHNHEPVFFCRASSASNAETCDNLSPTLTCSHDGSPIVFESHSQDARYTQQGDTSPTCSAQWGTGGNNMPLVAETIDCRNAKSNGDLSGTLQAKTNGGYSLNYQNPVAIKQILRWIVRRLTPLECERLQGYPDGWTDIGEWYDDKGKKHKPADSPRYKAMGNSIALPQWWWLICKMAKYLPEKPTLGSLFDGVGGFPLVWETRFGKGTAIWASEIEPFPIAVTKKRFN